MGKNMTALKITFVLCLSILLDGSCDPQKQDARISSLEAEVKQLKAEVAELKQKEPEHHYELRSEGARTFRFDPATGDTCIQLTSVADWKRKETKLQSCACVDATKEYRGIPADEDQQAKQGYYHDVVAPACGNDK